MSGTSRHPLDDWARDLGKVVSAFQGLEFVLRAFLYEREAAPGGRFPYAHDFHADALGAVVPLNAITDYRTLGQLIGAYNGMIASLRPEAVINVAIVGVRDALAHGRVSASEPGEALRLLKYDKPTKAAPGTVRVTECIQVNRAWLREQLEAVQGATIQVVRAHEELPKSGAV